MKKLLLSSLLLVCSVCCIFSTAQAQYVGIPDSNFGKWLNTNGYATCMIGNSTSGWMLDTSCNLVLRDTAVDCMYSNIGDLTGISYFKNLKRLQCYGNQLTSLSILPSTLTYLDCSNNQLSSLPALPSLLNNLSCYDNQLISLPVLPNSIIILYCFNNRLTSLPALPTSLNNLGCRDNQLTSLPALPSSLNTLVCSNNQLTGIPTLPASLQQFDCGSNQLTSLPTLPDSLIYLRCNNNPNLSCLPRIFANNLSSFAISGTQITCLPNRFTANYFDVKPDTIPLCTPSSGCDFYYNIAGNIHNDTAANCANDSLYPGSNLKNVKVLLKRGGVLKQQFITGSGEYSFKTDSLTSYEVSLDTAGLPFRVACPANGVRAVNLTPIDSVRFNESFGVVCKGADYNINSIYGWRFRPATQTTVAIDFENQATKYGLLCNNVGGGTITTTLSIGLKYISPASGALTPTTVSNSAVTYTIADLNTVTMGSLDIIVATDTFAPAGSQVCITTTVSSTTPDINPSNDALTQCFTVRNSYDPNLKEVSPAGNVQSDQWLTYTVGFQNTGNDTAYTVIIKDTLSQSLDESSFEYIASSHKAIMQLMGGAMTFTFPRINLVDSMHNEPLSHGWIQYKVKTKPNLATGTQIKNTASIYFDFNPAIVTNTVTSTVQLCTTSYDTINPTICPSASYTVNGHSYTTAGTYQDTVRLSTGCDSVITTNLIVKTLKSDTTIRAICAGDTTKWLGTSYTAAGTYSKTNGCDSIRVLKLTVNPLPVVMLTFDSLAAHGKIINSKPSYQWCPIDYPSVFAMVGGLPSGGHYSGDYIARDTFDAMLSRRRGLDTFTYTYSDQNNCVNRAFDTIRIVDCNGNSIHDLALSSISLHPNPNQGSFTLETTGSRGVAYTIYDILGQVIQTSTITSDSQQVQLEGVAKGIYTLSIAGRGARFVVE